MPMQLIAVHTTVSTDEQADRLATGAVEQGLAACVQVEPVRSTYLWKGRLERDNEVRVLFKTTIGRYQALARWLSDHHPYELPAIYATAVREATPEYAQWVRESVGP